MGTIPQKYDVAITTACGNLETMVVENMVVAEKCMQFLREHRLGRLNFICLDRVTEIFGKAMSNEFNCPRQAMRLFDLIQPNEQKFRIAFYYGIRDTLVCESLDIATAINKE